MSKKKILTFHDRIEVFDRLNPSAKDRYTRPKGLVEIYERKPGEKDRKLRRKSNLIVYRGRSWIMERCLNVNCGQASVPTNQDMWINWFGVGTGGVGTDPFDPIPPELTDIDLSSECPIASTGTDLADFRGGNFYKHPINSITFEQDPDNNNAYLIAALTTTLTEDQCNGYLLSEAGLFVSESSTAGYAGPFYLFARVTFSTIEKLSERELDFVWYLYF